jgi:serine/threonine-protein kinase RsbT
VSSIDLSQGIEAEVQIFPLRSDEDVMRSRSLAREHAVDIGLSLIDQTKFVTAASELARNTLRYGGGGEVQVRRVMNGDQLGCQMKFIDRGPGIADVALALTDGYTSGGGLGLGLGGSKRLVDEFEIETQPGVGTTVTICKWKRF